MSLRGFYQLLHGVNERVGETEQERYMYIYIYLYGEREIYVDKYVIFI